MMKKWVIRLVPKYIRNEDKNYTLSPFLHYLRLVVYNYNCIVNCFKSIHKMVLVLMGKEKKGRGREPLEC